MPKNKDVENVPAKDDAQPKAPEIVCMPSSIKIFRIYGGFPPKNKELNPGTFFYLKFVLLAVGSSSILVGSLLHLIKNIQANTFYHMELDLTYVISMSAGYGLLFSYFTKIHAAVQLYLFLSNFEEFGKPVNFDETNKKYNRYSIYHYCYLESIVIFILLGSNVFKGKSCERENEELGTHEVCGLFTYTWMPFNIDFFPIKQLYLFTQLFGAHYIYMMAGLAAWMVLESVQHIATRIRHVTYLFNEALKEQDAQKRRRKFNHAIKYHVAVLGLEDKLNQTFSVFMFTHMVMTGGIMGYGIYAYMKGKNISSLLLAIGWLFGLLMDCRGGQIIQNESVKVGLALYDADWSHCEPAILRDISFVLMRCQRIMRLKAASFGVMDHPMFLAVCKATYSYITLLNQTEEDDN